MTQLILIDICLQICVEHQVIWLQKPSNATCLTMRPAMEKKSICEFLHVANLWDLNNIFLIVYNSSWACGVIMFTLLVGCPPFWHRKQMIMLRNIMEGKYSFMSPEWSDISGESRRIAQKPISQLMCMHFSNHFRGSQRFDSQMSRGRSRKANHR